MKIFTSEADFLWKTKEKDNPLEAPVGAIFHLSDTGSS